MLALARAAVADGRFEDARKAVSALWRDRDFDVWTEGAVLREFASLLSRADHKYRADRLLYAEKGQAALRAAALAGADEVALARARLEAAVGPLSPRSAAAVPAALQTDPGLLFAKIQDARRTGRTADATALFAQSPRDAATLIDPDKWWSERRMVAREWLDKGENEKAYALCAEATTVSSPAQVDAAFHAGWIALRFLNDPARATPHFDDAIAAAQTPLSIARAYYWRGRAAEATGASEAASLYYANAAAYPIAYYGQLAARRLGRPDPARPRAAIDVAAGDQRWLPTRVAELLYEAGQDDFATSLAYSAANSWRDEGQLAALGDVISQHGSAPVSVTFGKLDDPARFCARPRRVPRQRRPRVYAARPLRGCSERAWRRAAGKRVHLACRLRRGRQGLDADPADHRAVDRAPRRRRVRLRSADLRSRFQSAARRGLSRPTGRRRRRLDGDGARRL